MHILYCQLDRKGKGQRHSEFTPIDQKRDCLDFRVLSFVHLDPSFDDWLYGRFLAVEASGFQRALLM